MALSARFPPLWVPAPPGVIDFYYQAYCWDLVTHGEMYLDQFDLLRWLATGETPWGNTRTSAAATAPAPRPLLFGVPS